MKKDNSHWTTKEELITVLGKLEVDILVTLGAGDIDTCVPMIHKWLETKEHAK